MLVMVDETTGDRFARLAGQKGLGEDREMMWLVKDAAEELRAWGHPGGPESRLILKCDGRRTRATRRPSLERMTQNCFERRSAACLTRFRRTWRCCWRCQRKNPTRLVSSN